MTKQGSFDIMDLIAFWSLDIGLQNLSLNKQQVDTLMSELKDNQDSLLKVIIEQNNRIINLLKELKNDTNRNIK